jgi:hypothetical protein
MSLHLYDKAMADFKKMFAPECNCRVTLDDKHVCACHEELSGTKFPVDPYGCENPVSGDEE